MQLATASWIAAGVALAGASVIAVTPVAPPLPDVEVPAVQLTAGEDTITAWEDVFSTASANATSIFDEWSGAPFPVLQQVIANQIGYLGELPDFQTIFGDISDHLKAAAAVPFAPDDGVLDTAHLEALNGVIGTGVIPASLLSPELLDSPILSVASGVLVGALGLLVSPILAVGDSIHDIVTALTGPTPDLTAALDDLTNIPANIADAFLNGQFLDGTQPEIDLTPLLPLLSQLGLSTLLPATSTLNSLDIDMGGLLSPGGSLFNALGFDLTFNPALPTEPPDGFALAGSPVGLIGSLVDLSHAIAEAIGWSGTVTP